MNDVFDLIVARDVAYAARKGGGTISGINEIDLLEVGAVAFFTESNVLVTAATLPAALAGVKSFFVAVGRTGDVKQTLLIDRDAHERTKCVYRAPVLQISHVGNNGSTGALNLPATFIANEEAEITIWEMQDGIEPAVAKQRHSISSKASDTTATFLQRMVDKINAESDYVDAAIQGANVGIRLTAKNKNFAFSIGTNGLFADSDIIYTTPTVYSQGDGDEVAATIENQSRIYDGATSPYWFPDQMFSQPKEVDPTGTYDCYQIRWEQESPSAIKSRNSKFIGADLYVPNGAAVITDIDAIFALLLTALPSTGSGHAPFGVI